MGYEDIQEYFKKNLGIGLGETTRMADSHYCRIVVWEPAIAHLRLMIDNDLTQKSYA